MPSLQQNNTLFAHKTLWLVPGLSPAVHGTCLTRHQSSVTIMSAETPSALKFSITASTIFCGPQT